MRKQERVACDVFAVEVVQEGSPHFVMFAYQ